jgi:serine/threonine protein phosphatase PrpC
VKFTIYQESRIGKRKNNEDRIAHCYSREALLMVVADGMGGHFYGEVAAQIAVQTLTEAFQREADPAIGDPFMFLQRAMMRAHHAIFDFSIQHNLSDSPRTTCVACIVQDNIAYWAHAGDSRLYLIREGKAFFRTRDHSRVQLLMDEGIITQAQAARHPERNKVYSCLGGPQTPEIELSRKTPLNTADVLALCSDGVWGPLSDEFLAQSLNSSTNLIEAIPLLLDKAETRGGLHADNLSIVAVRWEQSYADEAANADSVVSTEGMSGDKITTRLDKFGRNPDYKSDLTEDDIERAIEEIRSTIEKYTQ